MMTGEKPWKTEAEMGVRQPRAKELHGLPGTTRGQGEAQDSTQEPSDRWSCRHRDFLLLTPSTVQQLMSVVKPPVSGHG